MQINANVSGIQLQVRDTGTVAILKSFINLHSVDDIQCSVAKKRPKPPAVKRLRALSTLIDVDARE